MNYKVGAHLSIAGGYENALRKTIDIGGNCLQIFAASPLTWNFASPDNVTIQQFNNLRRNLKVEPIYFHASYLINLADGGKIGQLSTNLLIHELKVASKLGIRGTIVHLGSYKDTRSEQKYKTLITNIQKVLSQTPENTIFIIENAGNKKIGQKLEEIGTIVEALNDKRVKICLDTCHLHGGGYDLSTQQKFDEFFFHFDKLIGLSKLELFQAQDSKDPLASSRDRHENLGKGTIPIETFRLLLTDPKTKNLPLIIETPGFDQKGPDKRNLDILKSWAV